MVEHIVASCGFLGSIQYELTAPVLEALEEEVSLPLDPTTQLSLFDAPSAPISTTSLELRDYQAALRIDSFEDAKSHMAGLDSEPHPFAPTFHEGSARRMAVPPRVTEEQLKNAGLQPQFTLASWVHGTENRILFGAAKAVVQQDAAIGPVLFIQGGVGLGKTHLLQGIGNRALQENPTLRVRYLRAETFLNEFVEALSTKSTAQFRQRFRSDVDLLLLDDIEFLANKTHCQQELMHALTDLAHRQKTVVIASGSLREDLEGFNARLISQFSSGLSVRIDPPSEDARYAILQQLAAQRTAAVSPEVLHLVARTVRSNSREMVNHFNSILAYARFGNLEISVDFARGQLEKEYKQERVKVTADGIIDETIGFYGVERAAIIGRGRTKQVVTPRKVAMYLTRALTEMSFPELGRLFGGRDHTTIMGACTSIEAQLTEDRELQNAIKTIERRLGVV